MLAEEGLRSSSFLLLRALSGGFRALGFRALAFGVWVARAAITDSKKLNMAYASLA